MNELTGTIESVHAGGGADLSKDAFPEIQVELDGIVDDKHRGYVRQCWDGDKQPKDSPRRNERQWSAVSLEELAEIAAEMGASDEITAASVGANLCISGVPELSRLPKGTLLKFASGAELIVEEYNPPCKYMSEIQGKLHKTAAGEDLSTTAFSKAATLKRGIVGVVEAAGKIRTGDAVTVVVYETPSWLTRSDT